MHHFHHASRKVHDTHALPESLLDEYRARIEALTRATMKTRADREPLSLSEFYASGAQEFANRPDGWGKHLSAACALLARQSQPTMVEAPHVRAHPLKRYSRLQTAFAYLGAVRAVRLACKPAESLSERDEAYLLSVLP